MWYCTSPRFTVGLTQKHLFMDTNTIIKQIHLDLGTWMSRPSWPLNRVSHRVESMHFSEFPDLTETSHCNHSHLTIVTTGGSILASLKVREQTTVMHKQLYTTLDYSDQGCRRLRHTSLQQGKVSIAGFVHICVCCCETFHHSIERASRWLFSH